MSTIDDFSKLCDSDYPPTRENSSLLSKYQIPISHFEFIYIEKCTNGQELEKILLVLRSGEEGYFPDLETTTENRLKEIKPKSTLLRSSTQVLNRQDLEPKDFETILSDLNLWVNQVSKDDTELEIRKSKRLQQDIGVRKNNDIDLSTKNKNNQKEKRIGSTDFKAWDKYDPDTELLKMQLVDEKQKHEISERELKRSKKQTKSISFNECGTEAEARFLSKHEREKGNEFFKNEEYEEALHCYTNSIVLKSSIENLNNRAMTYIKLHQYPNAVTDCHKILNLDANNLKAHWRLAEALEKMMKYEEALQHIEFVIQVDPNNNSAQKLANNIRKNCVSNIKHSKMLITEIN